MAFIKKILFPVDFSASSLAAARYVEAFAGRFEAEIMLLHVVGPGEHTLPEELLPLRRAELNTFLVDELKYFTTQRICVIGDDPAAAIVAEAERWEPDLVMMPTHGLGGFKKLFLGSVTAQVLENLNYPLWTTVHSEVAPPLENIHCRRILCALDLTDRSWYVLDWAAALAAEYEACLGIVHATRPMPRAVMSVDLEKELNSSAADQARAEILQLLGKAGVDGPIFIDADDPAALITRTATSFNADLLVIGRHQSGPEDSFAILRGSPCPVVSC